MKHFTFLVLGTILALPTANANPDSNGFAQMADKGVAIGVSPSGNKVFGYNGRSGDASQSSWIFDVDTRTTFQLTEFSESDLDKGGQAMWINSAGTVAGTLLDNDWRAPEITDALGESLYDYPMYTACLWKDGILKKLDHNRWEDPAAFVATDGTLPAVNNGFVAKQINEDESAVAGYLKAFTYMLPVRWTLNEDGEYSSTMLYRPKGTFFYQWVGASVDCQRIIMNTSQSGGESYIWNGDNDPVIFAYQENGSNIEEAVLTALSPSGRYAIMSCTRDNKPAHAVFDFDSETVKWITLPEGAASSNWFVANVITDEGDGFISDYNYQLHYFNTELGINIPFKSYVEAFGSSVSLDDISALPSKAMARMTSTDGRTICGNTLQNSLENNGWIVRLPEESPMLFALKNCQAMYTSTSSILVKWEEPKLPAGAKIDLYKVCIDNGEAQVIEASLGSDGLMRAQASCSSGTHSITLYAVATDKDGKQWESVHQSLSVSISADTSLFFFENLDDSEIDEMVMAYLYTHDTFTPLMPTDSRALTFRVDAGDFCNLTPFWYTCGFAPTEWHTYMESRWFDASDCKEDFYFTWQERNLPINSATKYAANNRFALECTTDGENWVALNESNGAANGGKWNVRTVDLSSLRGKAFRLRFHAIGGGDHACEWRVDFYGIMPSAAIFDAPRGLMVVDESEKEITLGWKNNRDEYEVSYNYNSPMTYNQNLGNEGEPLYVACDYGPSKLHAFEGKYITSVSTMLYEPATVGQDYHTTVQAVIFDENGNELSRGTLADDVPWYDEDDNPIIPIHNICLNTPVLIESGKTYRTAILISNYEPEMCPIWYFSASDDYLPGITDLYSDDNLNSWNSFSEFWEEESSSSEEFDLYGRCIFNIRPGISDTPNASSSPYEQLQWFYQVFRDGELLPYGIAYFTQQTVTDRKIEGAAYTVQSYRRDGAVSAMSEPFNYSASSINVPVADIDFSMQKTQHGVLFTGDFQQIEVYNIHGVKISSSAFLDAKTTPRGVYIVVLKKNGESASYKIAF